MTETNRNALIHSFIFNHMHGIIFPCTLRVEKAGQRFHRMYVKTFPQRAQTEEKNIGKQCIPYRKRSENAISRRKKRERKRRKKKKKPSVAEISANIELEKGKKRSLKTSNFFFFSARIKTKDSFLLHRRRNLFFFWRKSSRHRLLTVPVHLPAHLHVQQLRGQREALLALPQILPARRLNHLP